MAREICVIEGEDAAPEAVRPTVELLKELDVDLTFTTPKIEGHESKLDNGEVPEEIRDLIEESDTVLFGSASGTHVPIIRYLRYEYGGGLVANVRPIRYIPGAASPLSDPGGIDYVIIRENLEGLYYLAEGDLSELAEKMPDLNTGISITENPISNIGPGKYAVRVITEDNTQELAQITNEICEGWGDDVTLTCGTKSNVLSQSDGLFRDVIETVAEEGGIDYEHFFVDDLSQRLVTMPKSFDVVVMPNFIGDVLSDLGAGTIGGLGLAPSGCYGPEKAYFEPVHGTAPDIAGQNVINPTATILSAVMMLEYLGLDESANRLDQAVVETYAAGEPLTPDQGGDASTTEFAEAVADRL